MPRISSKHFENFGDGLLTICEADERSLTRTKLEHIRFGNRTVGVKILAGANGRKPGG